MKKHVLLLLTLASALPCSNVHAGTKIALGAGGVAAYSGHKWRQHNANLKTLKNELSTARAATAANAYRSIKAIKEDIIKEKKYHLRARVAFFASLIVAIFNLIKGNGPESGAPGSGAVAQAPSSPTAVGQAAHAHRVADLKRKKEEQEILRKQQERKQRETAARLAAEAAERRQRREEEQRRMAHVEARIADLKRQQQEKEQQAQAKKADLEKQLEEAEKEIPKLKAERDRALEAFKTFRSPDARTARMRAAGVSDAAQVGTFLADEPAREAPFISDAMKAEEELKAVESTCQLLKLEIAHINTILDT